MVWFLLTLRSPGVLVGSRAVRFWVLGWCGDCRENTGATVGGDPQPGSCGCSVFTSPTTESPPWQRGGHGAQFIHILGVILKLPDKQKLHCRLITLFGKNRAALALQRKGLVTWRRERAQGCRFPVEECVFGECCPGGIWNLKHLYLQHFSLADAAPGPHVSGKPRGSCGVSGFPRMLLLMHPTGPWGVRRGAESWSTWGEAVSLSPFWHFPAPLPTAAGN